MELFYFTLLYFTLLYFTLLYLTLLYFTLLYFTLLTCVFILIKEPEGIDIAVDSKLDATDAASDNAEESVKSSKKENVRKYCLTKFTMLTEMKRLAKYDRKVLECGSKAFMSFLKVSELVSEWESE